MTLPISDEAALAARIADVAPLLAERVRDTDTNGVAADVVTALRDAGLLAVQDPRLRLDAGRALARICGATALLASELGEGADLANAITAAAPDGLVTVARHGSGSARETASGYVIDGTWHAVGGVAHADWVVLLSLDEADGAPLAALVRRDEVETETYHYLGGLRGVGWHTVAARGLVLPSNRVARRTNLAAVGPGVNRLAGVIVGCAEGGYADYVQMTRARIAGIGGAAVATFTQVQARLAESDADLRTVVHMYDGLRRDLDVTDDAEIVSRIARDRAFLARKALDAVTRLVRQMGAMGLAETNPVQRRYRDLRAVGADESFAWDANLAQFGRRALGIVEQVESAA